MRRRLQQAAVVGLACVLGLGWAWATPRVQNIQELQPQPEIPLYEGAQVEWEVHLTAQEMAKKLIDWVQALGSLKISGYRLEGQRVLETVNFYDQELSTWRRIVWVRPTESGAIRLFAKDHSYLFLGISKGYEMTEIVLATAQTEITPVDVPTVEGSQLQWELVLTSQDLLEHLKRSFADLIENPPAAMRMRIWEQPERPESSLLGVMSWLGVLGIDVVSRLLTDFSELRLVGYKLDGNKALEALSFYEQRFSEWRRNLWIKPDESGSVRVFTRSDAQGLQEISVVAAMSFGFGEYEEAGTNVLVLRARR
jgi:hypothetical protein